MSTLSDLQSAGVDVAQIRAAIPPGSSSAGDQRYADAIESMSLSLHSAGVAAETINGAIATALEAFANNTDAEPDALPPEVALWCDQLAMFRRDYDRYDKGDASMPFSELRQSLDLFLDASTVVADKLGDAIGQDGLRDFTVMGFFADNELPFSETVRAPDEQKAAFLVAKAQEGKPAFDQLILTGVAIGKVTPLDAHSRQGVYAESVVDQPEAFGVKPACRQRG